MQLARKRLPVGLAWALGLTLVFLAACAPAGGRYSSSSAALAPTASAGPRTAGALLTANEAGHSISVVDPGRLSVLETIDLGFPPVSVAVTPDGREAFVVNGAPGADRVVVVDLATKRVVATIPVGKDPTRIVIVDNGQSAFVTNSGSSSISIIDVPRRTTIGTVPAGGTPVNLAVATSQRQTTLYVVDQANNQVLPVSVGVSGAPPASPVPRGGAGPGATPTPYYNVTSPIPVGIHPVDVAVNAANGVTDLYVADRDGGVTIVHLTQQSRKATELPVSGHPSALALSPDAKTLLVTVDQPTSQLVEVDLSGPRMGRTIPLGTSLTDVAYGANSKRAFVIDGRKDTLSAIDPTSGKVEGTVQVGKDPTFVTYAPKVVMAGGTATPAR